GAAPRLHLDYARRRELEQGLAQRRARDVEALRELHLVEAHAGRERAGGDAFLDHLPHVLRAGSGLALHALRSISRKWRAHSIAASVWKKSRELAAMVACVVDRMALEAAGDEAVAFRELEEHDVAGLAVAAGIGRLRRAE